MIHTVVRYQQAISGRNAAHMSVEGLSKPQLTSRRTLWAQNDLPILSSYYFGISVILLPHQESTYRSLFLYLCKCL